MTCPHGDHHDLALMRLPTWRLQRRLHAYLERRRHLERKLGEGVYRERLRALEGELARRRLEGAWQKPAR